MDLRGGWKRIDRRDIAGHRGGEAGARLCVGRRGLRHKTVLFVTHQIDEAIYLSDRVIVLSSRPGRIAEIVAPGLPRPRTIGMKHLPEFHALIEMIWGLVQTKSSCG